MGSEKHGSSETLSDQETSHSPESSKDHGLGLLYECTFCKRGFTNAQALGGHMNIHRKDKAKAKQQKTFRTTITSALTKSNKDHDLIDFSESFKFIPNEEAQYLGSSIGFRTDHDHGYQFTPSNPNSSWNLAASLYDNRALNDERLRVNLNIGIGTSGMQNSGIGSAKVGQEDWFENDVDLELRLGHYP